MSESNVNNLEIPDYCFSWRPGVRFILWASFWTVYMLVLCIIYLKLYGGMSEKFKGASTTKQPPPLPQSMSEVGGTEPIHWFSEKTLLRSDISPRQGRIFIPQTVKDFLTPAELRKYWVLLGDSNNREKEKKEYTVTLIEPDGTKSEIDFKIMGRLDTAGQSAVGEGQPVLTGSNWNLLVRKYNMEAGIKWKFWCLRDAKTNELWFGINNMV